MWTFQAEVTPNLQSWHFALSTAAVSASIVATNIQAVGCVGGQGWPESSLIYNGQQAFNVFAAKAIALPNIPLAGDWLVTPVGAGAEYRLTAPACFLLTMACR
jgi:hypothetical protein